MDKVYFILPLIFAAGYLFGVWTCGMRANQDRGFILTILIFIFLNLIHSIVDGTLLRSLTPDLYSFAVIAAHEAIRQPLLYLFFFSAIGPFAGSLWQKIPLGLLAVTGTWILGLGIGSSLTLHFKYLPHNEIAFFIYAFFGGDVFHHCVDYLKQRRRGSIDNPSSH